MARTFRVRFWAFRLLEYYHIATGVRLIDLPKKNMRSVCGTIIMSVYLDPAPSMGLSVMFRKSKSSTLLLEECAPNVRVQKSSAKRNSQRMKIRGRGLHIRQCQCLWSPQ